MVDLGPFHVVQRQPVRPEVLFERVARGEDAGQARKDVQAVGRGPKDPGALAAVVGDVFKVGFADENARVIEGVCHGGTLWRSVPHASSKRTALYPFIALRMIRQIRCIRTTLRRRCRTREGQTNEGTDRPDRTDPPDRSSALRSPLATSPFLRVRRPREANASRGP